MTRECRHPLHESVCSGDLAAVQRWLSPEEIHSHDDEGYQPLMRAVLDRAVPLAVVDALLQAGADVNALSRSQLGIPRCVLSLAVSAGDPERVGRLIHAGAEVGYGRDGYGVLIDAVHGRTLRDDAQLLPLLQLLVDAGARLNDVTRYSESALRVLSRLGRFDAVELLLGAGADESQLGWTPLIRCVALDTVDELSILIASGCSLEDRDFWHRTAWLVALAAGSVDKAKLLQAAGADVNARGRVGKLPICYAIDGGDPATLDLAISVCQSLDEVDEHGHTALMHAAEEGDVRAARRLLEAGADAEKLEEAWSPEALAHAPADLVSAMMAHSPRGCALNRATDAETARLLLAAGADPAQLSSEARRDLLGLPPDSAPRLLTATVDKFAAGRRRRFGRHNPEPMPDPFWLSMIRSGLSAYEAGCRFNTVSTAGDPIWCARRFGQSISFLEDGRIVQVGGEHEDHYDEDFCIYNDVFVHHPDGRIDIYGYPESEFPPTDFHSATIVGERLLLIGCLGYPEQRRPGCTPVYTLDLRSFRIERLQPEGNPPGWLCRHRARLRDGCVVVAGGKLESLQGGKPRYGDWGGSAVLQLSPLRWLDKNERQ